MAEDADRLKELEEDERNLKEHVRSLEVLASESTNPDNITALQLKYVERQIDTYIRLVAANLTEQRKLKTQQNRQDLTPTSSKRQSLQVKVDVPTSPPPGYRFETTTPLAILPSRLLKRRVYIWYLTRWVVCEVVGGPKDPKQSSQGYTLQVKSSKLLDGASPEHLRREAEGMRLNVHNYGHTWFLLNDQQQPPPEEEEDEEEQAEVEEQAVVVVDASDQDAAKEDDIQEEKQRDAPTVNV